jgi:hypothetical protein
LLRAKSRGLGHPATYLCKSWLQVTLIVTVDLQPKHMYYHVPCYRLSMGDISVSYGRSTDCAVFTKQMLVETNSLLVLDYFDVTRAVSN